MGSNDKQNRDDDGGEERGSPLDALPEGFRDAFSRQGYTELTAIQEAVLSPGLEGRDLRISSQTGSGKTVALGLVVATHLSDTESKRKSRKAPARPTVLLDAPTRELAAQLGQELAWLYGGRELGIAVVTGGTAVGGDLRALAEHPALLIGTPGRLVDHLERGSLVLDQLRAVVLDEADEMLDLGFRDELERILADTPEEKQTHMVSATFPPKVRQLADAFQRNAMVVEGTVGQQHADIEHRAMLVEPKDRFGALVNLLLLHPEDRMLVFVRTRVAATGVAGDLSALGLSARALSGEMAQRERTACLAAFRARRVQCLVATDVAARGLDIAGVPRVVHFDLPQNRQTFTHRSGRTGRAGEQGENVLMVPPRMQRRIDRQLGEIGVQAKWGTPPTVEQVHRAQHARLLRRFGGSVSEPSGADEFAPSQKHQKSASESERVARLESVARELLERRDEGELVTELLAALDATAVDPVEVRRVDLRPDDAKRGARPSGRGPKGPAGGPFVRFHVTWGERTGATPPRLLAHVCRRGGIDGSDVGAIDIRAYQSTVEVAASVAERFEKTVRRPDPRNPKVYVRRFEERRGAAFSPSKPTKGKRPPRSASNAADEECAPRHERLGKPKKPKKSHKPKAGKTKPRKSRSGEEKPGKSKAGKKPKPKSKPKSKPPWA